jgi:hypothetical protein
MFIFISLCGNIRPLLRKVVESGSCRVQFDLSRLSKDLPSHQVYNPAFEILRQANKMELSLFYEMIGYMGSLLVAFSLTMKSLQKLRIVNMVGALFFITYGLLIGALPIALLNGLTLCVNIYNLWGMWQRRDYFTLMQVRADSAYLIKFLDFYRREISEFIPTYQFKPDDNQVVVFILRNMLPVGLVVVRPEGEEACIFLDFVIPGYRDFRAGKFLLEESAEFYRQMGILRLSTAPGSRKHETYLNRMGFQQEEDGRYYYILPTRIIREHI